MDILGIPSALLPRLMSTIIPTMSPPPVMSLVVGLRSRMAFLVPLSHTTHVSLIATLLFSLVECRLQQPPFIRPLMAVRRPVLSPSVAAAADRAGGAIILEGLFLLLWLLFNASMTVMLVTIIVK